MARPAPLSGPASKNFQPRPTKLNPPNPERPEFFFERDDGSLFWTDPPGPRKTGSDPPPVPKMGHPLSLRWDTDPGRVEVSQICHVGCPGLATSHCRDTPCPSTATVGRGVPDGGHPLSPKWDMSGIRARSIPPDPGPAAGPPAPPIRARPCPPDPGSIPGPCQRPRFRCPSPPDPGHGRARQRGPIRASGIAPPLARDSFYGEKMPPRRWPPIRARPNEISRIDLAPLDI